MCASVLDEMAEKGARGRHSDKWVYKVRPREGHSIKFKIAERDWFGRSVVVSTAPVTSPTVIEIELMDEEIKEAQFILKIENDLESADFVPYSEETLARATSFLRRMVIGAHSAGLARVGVPQIGPADHGSIDLFWEKSDRTLLVNFPKLESVANFYGKKATAEISGRLDLSQAGLELAYWLVG